MIVPSWDPVLRQNGYLKISRGFISKILVMTSHIYNTRNSPLSKIEENVSSKANFEVSKSSTTSETAWKRR